MNTRRAWTGAAVAVLIGGALCLVLAAVLRDGSSPSEEVPAVAAGPMTCMPDPSACGFPDPGTTGVTPGTPLTPDNGAITLSTPGQVYENRLLTGSITVTAPNVTIRNVKLVATDQDYGIRSFAFRYNVAGLTLDHVEIDLNGHYDIKGIAFDGYTARHLFIHNGSDCAHMGVDVDIEDSYCAVGPDANGDGIPDGSSFCSGPEHFDGFQSDGGRNLTIRHNTIRNPCAQTSAILMSTNTEPIDRVTIDYNLASGGGYTVYCGSEDGGVATNETYTRNVISREYYRTGGRWGPTTFCDKVASSGGNLWDGEFVPPPDGTTQPPGGSTGAAPTGSTGTVALALSIADAKRAARRGLARGLHTRYTRRSAGMKLSCKQRFRAVAGCSVSWTRRRGGRTLDRYTGTVVVTRTSAARASCGMTLRHWSRQCGCTRRIPASRARKRLVVSC